MSRNKVYASCEIADQEIRLIILEIFEGHFNVLRVERVACDGVIGQKIVNEANVVQAIRKAVNNAAAALGYRIERVLLAIPSVNVKRAVQKIHVQVEDGTKYIRLFHIQQGLNKAIQKKISDDVELVNVGQIKYIVDGRESTKMPISATIDDFHMNVELIYADKETIYAYARCVEQANLEIMDLCLDSYAIAQESAVQVKSMERNMIQLDLEPNHCTLSLFARGRLISCVDLDQGYNGFISELKEKYHLTDAVCYRLLQNIFSMDADPDTDKIIYIEQKEELRVEITRNELINACGPKIRQWVRDINEACKPIVDQGVSEYVLTGKGAGIGIFQDLLQQFNSNAVTYQPQSIGARDSSFICCLGMFYVYSDINRIRHSEKISVNNNELGASIDSINHQAKSGEGGFTKRLKSVILSEEE